VRGEPCAERERGAARERAVAREHAVGREPVEERKSGPPEWTTYRSADFGYAVSFPEGWQRATESLTPLLAEPREILSLGTFRLRYREGECEHVPTGALESMSEEDVLLTILERGARGRYAREYFPPRPASFAFEPDRGSEAPWCVHRPVRFADHWFAFTDARRHFHVLVALGHSAPAELRRQAYRILDTLRLDPEVRPDWPVSP
jgi:hypothetical protein